MRLAIRNVSAAKWACALCKRLLLSAVFGFEPWSHLLSIAPCTAPAAQRTAALEQLRRKRQGGSSRAAGEEEEAEAELPPATEPFGEWVDPTERWVQGLSMLGPGRILSM